MDCQALRKLRQLNAFPRGLYLSSEATEGVDGREQKQCQRLILRCCLKKFDSDEQYKPVTESVNVVESRQLCERAPKNLANGKSDEIVNSCEGQQRVSELNPELLTEESGLACLECSECTQQTTSVTSDRDNEMDGGKVTEERKCNGLVDYNQDISSETDGKSNGMDTDESDETKSEIHHETKSEASAVFASRDLQRHPHDSTTRPSSRRQQIDSQRSGRRGDREIYNSNPTRSRRSKSGTKNDSGTMPSGMTECGSEVLSKENGLASLDCSKCMEQTISGSSERDSDLAIANSEMDSQNVTEETKASHDTASERNGRNSGMDPEESEETESENHQNSPTDSENKSDSSAVFAFRDIRFYPHDHTRRSSSKLQQRDDSQWSGRRGDRGRNGSYSTGSRRSKSGQKNSDSDTSSGTNANCKLFVGNLSYKVRCNIRLPIVGLCMLVYAP